MTQLQHSFSPVCSQTRQLRHSHFVIGWNTQNVVPDRDIWRWHFHEYSHVLRRLRQGSQDLGCETDIKMKISLCFSVLTKINNFPPLQILMQDGTLRRFSPNSSSVELSCIQRVDLAHISGIEFFSSVRLGFYLGTFYTEYTQIGPWRNHSSILETLASFLARKFCSHS